MSRIRGIDIKVQKSILHSRRNGRNETKKRNDDHDHKKDDVERDQIKELLFKLPQLHKLFDVHRKIGEGTFSSVYLGSLRQHSLLPDADKRWFALKHLVPTSHPARVEQELKCLQEMGGKNNVIGVELCLRNLDTIVFIMPYIPHKKFSEYVGDMDSEELRQYMHALLTALCHVHSFGVIHRDVKPSNFLYDRDNRRYLLVDFGLAQRIITVQEESPCPLPLSAYDNSFKRRRDEDDAEPEVKRMALDLRVDTKPKICLPVAVTVSSTSEPAKQLPKPLTVKGAGVACRCAGAAGVCTACAARPAPRAPRAGTQGFRPPEVLLKYPHQTTAVDMWACGVVLATVLSGRYPFFRASDDVSALAELLDLLGTRALQRTATALGRRIVTSSTRRGLCLRKLCARLRSAPEAGGTEGPLCTHCRTPHTECLCRDDSMKAESFSPRRQVAGFPEAAFALASQLLEPAPHARLSAADALRHPFLAAPTPH